MQAKVVFFGTGSSVGCPVLRCIMQRNEKVCRVCEAAVSDPNGVHARSPPSLLIQRTDTRDGLLIDCGPGFKKSAIRFFPDLGLKSVKSVLLTHDHYDALASLNELREVQLASCPPGVWSVDTPMPVYGNAKALQTSSTMFPYLFGGKDFVSLTGKLHPVELDAGKPFNPEGFEGLEVTPLDLEHGQGYMALGFLLGSGGDTGGCTVAYLSDVSRIPEATLEMLQAADVGILVIDAISEDPRPSHFSVDQALGAVRDIAPGKAYLVGMGCSLEHHDLNTYLQSQDLPCATEAAYDGLTLDIVL